MDTYPTQMTFYFYWFIFLIFFFSQPHVSFTLTVIFFHLYLLFQLYFLLLFSTSPFCLFLLSHLLKFLCSPIWNFWLNFSVFFFFIAFFSNSVRLLLDFPTINPIRLPQIQYLKPWFKAPPFNVALPLILAAFQSFLIGSYGFFFRMYWCWLFSYEIDRKSVV